MTADRPPHWSPLTSVCVRSWGCCVCAEHIKEQIAAIGENIQVRRFQRYVLGEGIEKKVADFAAEVAAQTGAQL